MKRTSLMLGLLGIAAVLTSWPAAAQALDVSPPTAYALAQHVPAPELAAAPAAGAEVLAQLASPVGLPDLAADPAGFVVQAVQLLAQGNPAAALAVLVLAFVHLVRLVGVRWWPWLGTDRGGALLSLVTGVASALAAAAAAGVAWTPLSALAVLVTGVSCSWMASGAHSQLRRLAGRSSAQANLVYDSQRKMLAACGCAPQALQVLDAEGHVLEHVVRACPTGGWYEQLEHGRVTAPHFVRCKVHPDAVLP